MLTPEFVESFSKGILQGLSDQGIATNNVSVTGVNCGSIIATLEAYDAQVLQEVKSVAAAGNLSVYVGFMVFSASNPSTGNPDMIMIHREFDREKS
jgi:hypothetical protein